MLVDSEAQTWTNSNLTQNKFVYKAKSRSRFQIKKQSLIVPSTKTDKWFRNATNCGAIVIAIIITY